LEWLLNRNLGEMLIQFELGNPDLALSRLHAIERTLREQFPVATSPEAGLANAAPGSVPPEPGAPSPLGGPYHYVMSYLALVRKIIDDPAAARRPDFATRVENLPDSLPLQREDLQAISFYAWLRARMLGRPYYEVLLEVATL
jgi:hypothetical protein